MTITTKLHIGAGTITLPGWLNIDQQPLPGIDHVLDIRDGLPFENVEAIFAEHFIEHLTLREATEFLRECRRVLVPTGVLRLSTPNLDWVWVSHYMPPETLSAEHALQGCMELNRAFHGWGHRFLYNFVTLAELLRYCGFGEVSRCRYGQSEIPMLASLERHELSPPHEGIESLLIVEASGLSTKRSEFSTVAAPYLRDLELR